MTKTCRACHQALTLDQYYRKTNGTPWGTCRACVSAQARARRSPRPTLTVEQRAAIKVARQGGASLRKLAAEYGVSHQTISNIAADR